MLPKINNKSFLECTETDLETLKENPDFRENEYIDYKKNFAFLEISKGKERDAKISEFRSDVCAFANSEGGYLVFGISDENGCAKEIVGIDISDDNTDKFEVDRRNNLNGIYPRTPYLKFHFIKLQDGKYVVVIYIKHDSFAPYTHIKDENNYLMFKRSGNKKITMTYAEMKNMFNQSLSLDKEIRNYRIERIDYYRSQAETEQSIYSRFLLFHIIPETFLDSNYNQNMFVLQKTKGIHFSSIFSEFVRNTFSMPCVDGLRYIPYQTDAIQAECYVMNNGIVECFFPLDSITLRIGEGRYPNGFIPWEYIWNKIGNAYSEYTEKFKTFYTNEKIFVCISIIGCKGVTSDNNGFYGIGKIDRNLVLCSPVFTNNINDDEENELLSQKLYIEYLLSIGVRHDEKLNKLIQEVYNT